MFYPYLSLLYIYIKFLACALFFVFFLHLILFYIFFCLFLSHHGSEVMTFQSSVCPEHTAELTIKLTKIQK